MSERAEFKDLLNVTLSKVEVNRNGNNDEIIFYAVPQGQHQIRWRMYHQQDCCESVTIEDICGNVDDLVGSPIIRCSEDVNTNEGKRDRDNYDDSQTWTFYNIATVKGYVTIRWHGESNGYYSESVNFEEMDNED